VTGTVHPDRVITNAGAGVGDRLYLTKALGTGVITTALKDEECPPDILAGAVASMLALNSAAAEAMVTAEATACTDITGFGFAGHAHQLAHSSGVALEIVLEALPVLPGALQAAAGGHIPGGLDDNRSSFAHWISGEGSGDGCSGNLHDILYDPQTSGGLLISIPEARASMLEDALADRGVEVCAVGRAVEGEPGALILL
jgi:selenide,water dikinase